MLEKFLIKNEGSFKIHQKTQLKYLYKKSFFSDSDENFQSFCSFFIFCSHENFPYKYFIEPKLRTVDVGKEMVA